MGYEPPHSTDFIRHGTRLFPAARFEDTHSSVRSQWSPHIYFWVELSTFLRLRFSLFPFFFFFTSFSFHLHLFLEEMAELFCSGRKSDNSRKNMSHNKYGPMREWHVEDARVPKQHKNGPYLPRQCRFFIIFFKHARNKSMKSESMLLLLDCFTFILKIKQFHGKILKHNLKISTKHKETLQWIKKKES